MKSFKIKQTHTQTANRTRNGKSWNWLLKDWENVYFFPFIPIHFVGPFIYNVLSYKLGGIAFALYETLKQKWDFQLTRIKQKTISFQNIKQIRRRRQNPLYYSMIILIIKSVLRNKNIQKYKIRTEQNKIIDEDED